MPLAKAAVRTGRWRSSWRTSRIMAECWTLLPLDWTSRPKARPVGADQQDARALPVRATAAAGPRPLPSQQMQQLHVKQSCELVEHRQQVALQFVVQW